MKRKMSRDDPRRLMRGHWVSVFLITAMTMLEALLRVALAILMQKVIDAALTGSEYRFTWSMALILDLVLLVVSHGVIAWYTGSVSDRFTAKLRRKLLAAATYSRDAKLQSYHSGELLNRGMEDVTTICDGTMSAFPTLVGQLTSLAGAFAAVVLMYPSVAVVLIMAAAAIGGVVAWLRPVLKGNHRKVRQADELMMAEMQEDLQQLELIQSLQVQEQTLARFDNKIKESLAAKFTRRLWSVGANASISAASNLGTGVLLLWGASRVAGQTLSYGSLTALLQLLSLFRNPVVGLSGFWSRLTAVEVAKERLTELLTPVETPEKIQLPGRVYAVVFEDVTFGYSGDEEPVLNGFNARLGLDGWTCLTGFSGRGKTTVFKLILGLYAPQRGRIYLDTDIGEIPCSEQTRCLFAYVPQDYALFSGTILENMQIVAPEASDEEIRRALTVAQADFVWSTAAGEQTHVRENNTGLSKGQIQRLAIARAVLMNRPIFLLDECTSALDAHTEEEVLRNLSAINDQAILVTHRPEALERIDGLNRISMEKA